jgi:hypothetical protein
LQLKKNRKFRCHGNREHIFWLLVSCKIWFFIINMKFSIDGIPSCPILILWDLGLIMAVGQCSIETQNCDSWNILPSLWYFWTIENHHTLYWKYGTLAGLGNRPLAQVTMNSKVITILAQNSFKWALICSIWTTGTRVILIKVYFFGKGPGQGQIPGLLGHGHQIPDCTFVKLSRYYCGWKIGDRRTDGRHNDFSRAHFF